MVQKKRGCRVTLGALINDILEELSMYDCYPRLIPAVSGSKLIRQSVDTGDKEAQSFP